MIPTSPTSPVSWTAAAAPAVAPVPAVMAVAPAAAAARDAQAGLEQRRGQPRAATGTPGKRPGLQDPPDDAATEQARAERVREQAERLRAMELSRRETVEELRQALRKAWDASAAVVEQALAREAEAHTTAAQTARALDAYGGSGGSGDAAQRPPGISRRV